MKARLKEKLRPLENAVRCVANVHRVYNEPNDFGQQTFSGCSNASSASRRAPFPP